MALIMLSVATSHLVDVLSRVERKGLPLLALKSVAGHTRIVVERSAAAAAFVRALPPLMQLGANLSVNTDERFIASGFAGSELFGGVPGSKGSGAMPLSTSASELDAKPSSTPGSVTPPPAGHADSLYTTLIGMIAEANEGGTIFSLDASRHRLPNEATAEHLKEMVDAGVLSEATSLEEATAHLDRQTIACVRSLIEHKDLFAPHGVTIDLHPPVFTCEQAEALCQEAPHALSLKNLFMTDKKRKLKYLMTAMADTQTGFKPMAAAVEEAIPAMKPKGGMTFAPQTDLKALMQLLPGSVTPLGLLNDGDGQVAFFLDQNIFGAEAELVSCHPNACHASVTMHREALVRFLQSATGHAVTIIPMDGSPSKGLTADGVLANRAGAGEP